MELIHNAEPITLVPRRKGYSRAVMHGLPVQGVPLVGDKIWDDHKMTEVRIGLTTSIRGVLDIEVSDDGGFSWRTAISFAVPAAVDVARFRPVRGGWRAVFHPYETDLTTPFTATAHYWY